MTSDNHLLKVLSIEIPCLSDKVKVSEGRIFAFNNRYGSISDRLFGSCIRQFSFDGSIGLLCAWLASKRLITIS